MEKYFWGDGHIPTIDVHSTKKHEVLREYLRQYILIVGGSPIQRKSLTLSLIDGFAGGGLYKMSNDQVHQGSPLIFLRSTEEASFQLSQDREFTLNAEYFFVEKEKPFLNFLRKLLIDEGYKNRIDKNIFLIKGTFEENITEIIAAIQKRGRKWRSIFLLDQYGYSDVTIATLKNIFLQLPQAEVILTFAVDSMIDYMTNSPECEKMLNNLGLEYNLSSLKEEKQQKKWRSAIQFKLYRQLVESVGAKFFTNFFIKSSESSRSYWLLHLSMHSKARDEMQKLHWSFQNHFVSEGRIGLDMLAYDPYQDVDFTKQPSFSFTEEDKERAVESLFSEIPKLITNNEVSVGSFFESQCNNTPATFQMLADALKNLYQENEIVVLNEKGKRKRKGSKIKLKDRLVSLSQLRIDFSV